MKRCSKCMKEIGLFGRAYVCRGCNKVFCSEHIYKVSFGNTSIKKLYELNYHQLPEYSITKMSYVLCEQCKNTFMTHVGNLQQALCSYHNVKVYPITYLGKANNGSMDRPIQSDWHRDKSNCVEDLQIVAESLNYPKVIKVVTESDVVEEETEKGGVYKYRVFKMKGYACN